MSDEAHSSLGEEKEQESPDDIFYHYTTMDGLLGIVESGALWATHIRYLNDTSEFKTGPNVVAEKMIEEIDLDQSNSAKLDRFRPFFTQLSMPVYVTSFSAERSGDDLSQWRAYGGPHSGFSLGFSRDYLTRISETFLRANNLAGWSKKGLSPFVKCQYFDEKNQKDLRWLVDELLRKSTVENPNMSTETGAHLFARYSAGLKHRSFAAEKEWRIALIRADGTPFNELKFRRSHSLIIPYVQIPLKWDGQAIKIDRVVIGPTPHKEEVKQSVEMLLRKNRVEYREIAESAIPYRSW